MKLSAAADVSVTPAGDLLSVHGTRQASVRSSVRKSFGAKNRSPLNTVTNCLAAPMLRL